MENGRQDSWYVSILFLYHEGMGVRIPDII